MDMRNKGSFTSKDLTGQQGGQTSKQVTVLQADRSCARNGYTESAGGPEPETDVPPGRMGGGSEKLVKSVHWSSGLKDGWESAWCTMAEGLPGQEHSFGKGTGKSN